MKLRSVLFWIHLIAGTIAGVVILIMSVTGTLLTFQQSVLQIVERSQRFVAASRRRGPARRRRAAGAGARRVAGCAADDADAHLRSGRVRRPSRSGTQGTVFVNPYTGEILGIGSARARGFYRSVTNWHRWLAVEGEHRTTARAITGACNAAFLVLAVTGVYLWWPRQWTGEARLSGHVLPVGPARQSPRLQLAQRDWLLVARRC